MREEARQLAIYRIPYLTWLLLLAAAVLMWIGFRPAVRFMIGIWTGREEYSHGVLIPFIAAFLIWQQRGALVQQRFNPGWGGVLLTLVGAAVHVIGQLSSLLNVSQVGLLICIYGLVLSVVGWSVFRKLAVPMLILLFMIPLPIFLLNNVSAELQLLSSRVGVWFMRLFDVSVYLEGNVIDLGGYRLQVAEACDGLRYLFPLMTLAFVMAYLFKVAFWKRAVLFLSSIPISILMNSLRVGVIGVMVEHWGLGMAEGFLHAFQGWAVFMTSVALLVVEAVVLARIGADRKPLRQALGFDVPASLPGGVSRERRPVPAALCASIGLVSALTALSLAIPGRAEAIPQRQAFADFPLALDDWQGRREAMEAVYSDTLKLDDYILADYGRSGSRPVNLYIAWYDSQRGGHSAHSPRTCLPGGGWEIASFTQVPVAGTPLRVNRALIRYGNQAQLVYYWFQQRGRVVTNEYLVKWYLFWDSLTRNRTDGALVRVMVPLSGSKSDAEAEQQLADFVRRLSPLLNEYVPG